jgi:hypothetical protein
MKNEKLNSRLVVEGVEVVEEVEEMYSSFN